MFTFLDIIPLLSGGSSYNQLFVVPLLLDASDGSFNVNNPNFSPDVSVLQVLGDLLGPQLGLRQGDAEVSRRLHESFISFSCPIV